MVLLIGGSSHTGKTALAHRLMKKYGIPYLSIDHLKMGLIRSGMTSLTPEDDSELTPFLWNILKEMIKTAIENKQDLIIEGCYIPYDWKNSFSEEYLKEIECRFLIMSEEYISSHFEDIRKYADIIEKRLDDSWLTPEALIEDNLSNLAGCQVYDIPYIMIDKEYDTDIEMTVTGG